MNEKEAEGKDGMVVYLTFVVVKVVERF